jgi:hypothetical protein
MRATFRYLLCAVALSLLGCGKTLDSTRLDAPPEAGVAARETPRPPVPDLSAADDQAVIGASAAPDPESALQRGAGSYVYSRDPQRLAKEVAAACEGARRAGAKGFLRSLVADLYFSGVHPAAATEALLGSDCGSTAEIVEEMIAQGGAEAQEPVVERARRLKGKRAARQLESAAAAGLARRAGLAEVVSAPEEEPRPGYGMLYFPSVGEGSKLVTAMALNRLYEEAVPGYGVYTFILSGQGAVAPKGGDAARYSELFRMLETYVSVREEENGEPSAAAHVFLVPIKATQAGMPLIDQSAPELSDAMRGQLVQALRGIGQRNLAVRLERGAGPFLVATLEPTLMPPGPRAPWLIADLSALGPEHIYGVVDAFDRPIPEELSGRVESLSLIRKRLLELPVQPASAQGGKPGAASWVFYLGGQAPRAALASPDYS